MNKGHLCTGQSAGSQWCPLQRGTTVLSFGLKIGEGGRGGLVVKSNDYRTKAMRDGQGSPPRQWEKSDTPLPTTLPNCLTDFLIVCVYVYVCVCIILCVHITGRLEE